MVDRARFRTSRRKLAPRWLTEGEGELVGYSLDLIKDAWIERLRLGLLARFPQNGPDGVTFAPDDAIAAMGQDRRVVRGLNETTSSYVGRLLRWLDDRTTSGNPWSLMRKLAEYTGPGPKFRTVDARGNWFTRLANGQEQVTLKAGNWNWDGAAASRWSRFWVIIYPNGLWLPSPYNWGDASGPDWGESLDTIGSTAKPDEVDTIRSIVADWKPAGTKCVNIIVAFDAASFDPLSPEPNGLWGRNSKNVGGVQVPARLSTARYWDGV